MSRTVTAVRPKRGDESPMQQAVLQKWEYHVEEMANLNAVREMLSRLGEEGWELVSVTGGSSGDSPGPVKTLRARRGGRLLCVLQTPRLLTLESNTWTREKGISDMSLFSLARSVCRRLPRIARQRAFWRRPKLVPLTFEEVNRQRHEIDGVKLDRTPCKCPQCRRARAQSKAAAFDKAQIQTGCRQSRFPQHDREAGYGVAARTRSRLRAR